MSYGSLNIQIDSELMRGRLHYCIWNNLFQTDHYRKWGNTAQAMCLRAWYNLKFTMPLCAIGSEECEKKK